MVAHSGLPPPRLVKEEMGPSLEVCGCATSLRLLKQRDQDLHSTPLPSALPLRLDRLVANAPGVLVRYETFKKWGDRAVTAAERFRFLAKHWLSSEAEICFPERSTICLEIMTGTSKAPLIFESQGCYLYQQDPTVPPYLLVVLDIGHSFNILYIDFTNSWQSRALTTARSRISEHTPSTPTDWGVFSKDTVPSEEIHRRMCALMDLAWSQEVYMALRDRVSVPSRHLKQTLETSWEFGFDVRCTPLVDVLAAVLRQTNRRRHRRSSTSQPETSEDPVSDQDTSEAKLGMVLRETQESFLQGLRELFSPVPEASSVYVYTGPDYTLQAMMEPESVELPGAQQEDGEEKAGSDTWQVVFGKGIGGSPRPDEASLLLGEEGEDVPEHDWMGDAIDEFGQTIDLGDIVEDGLLPVSDVLQAASLFSPTFELRPEAQQLPRMHVDLTHFPLPYKGSSVRLATLPLPSAPEWDDSLGNGSSGTRRRAFNGALAAGTTVSQERPRVVQTGETGISPLFLRFEGLVLGSLPSTTDSSSSTSLQNMAAEIEMTDLGSTLAAMVQLCNTTYLHRRQVRKQHVAGEDGRKAQQSDAGYMRPEASIRMFIASTPSDISTRARMMKGDQKEGATATSTISRHHVAVAKRMLQLVRGLLSSAMLSGLLALQRLNVSVKDLSLVLLYLPWSLGSLAATGARSRICARFA